MCHALERMSGWTLSEFQSKSWWKWERTQRRSNKTTRATFPSHFYSGLDLKSLHVFFHSERALRRKCNRNDDDSPIVCMQFILFSLCPISYVGKDDLEGIVIPGACLYVLWGILNPKLLFLSPWKFAPLHLLTRPPFPRPMWILRRKQRGSNNNNYHFTSSLPLLSSHPSIRPNHPSKLFPREERLTIFPYGTLPRLWWLLWGKEKKKHEYFDTVLYVPVFVLLYYFVGYRLSKGWVDFVDSARLHIALNLMELCHYFSFN